MASYLLGMNVHSKSEADKDDKRRQIFDAALDLFWEGGFHAAPMAKLAQHAGIPVGTIYRHFESKEELIHALYTDIKARRIEATLAGYDPALSLRQRFDRLWRNGMEYCVTHPLEFRFAEQYAHSPYLRDAAKSIQSEIAEDLVHFYAEGYREGIFKTLPPEIITSLISGPMNALAARAISGTCKIGEARIQEIVDACWDAIANRT